MKTQYILSGLIAISTTVCACNESPYYDNSLESNQSQLAAGQNANATNNQASNDQNTDMEQNNSYNLDNTGASGDESANENNVPADDKADNTENDNLSDNTDSSNNKTDTDSGDNDNANNEDQNKNDSNDIANEDDTDVYIWGYTEQLRYDCEIGPHDSLCDEKWIRYIHSADDVNTILDDIMPSDADYAITRKENIKNKLIEIDYQTYQVGIVYFGWQPVCTFTYTLTKTSDHTVEVTLGSGEAMDEAESTPTVFVMMPADKTYEISLSEKTVSTQEHIEMLNKQDYIQL